MAKLTDFNIGDKVLYFPHEYCHLSEIENGIVTSKNNHFIFVKYGNDKHSKATAPEKLKIVS